MLSADANTTVLQAVAVKKIVYVGADGREYDTESEALRSLVKQRLADILIGDRYSYDFDANEAADDLITAANEVTQLLATLRAAS